MTMPSLPTRQREGVRSSTWSPTIAGQTRVPRDKQQVPATIRESRTRPPDYSIKRDTSPACSGREQEGPTTRKENKCESFTDKEEVADHRHLMWFDTDFFVGFAKGRHTHVTVVFFHAPARKADLPCVVLELRGTLRKQYR